jgi:levanbiose-producing levanase
LRLTIVVDRNSVEVFAGGGEIVVTDLIFPALDDNRLSLFVDDGTATFSDISITDLPDPRSTRHAR